LVPGSVKLDASIVVILSLKYRIYGKIIISSELYIGKRLSWHGLRIVWALYCRD